MHGETIKLGYVVSFLAFEVVEFASSDGAQYLSGSSTF